MTALWPYATPGIPDALFEQIPGIPMSKREVRMLVLGYLRLTPSAVLWDVGAGTGTIAVEAALLCRQGKVVAVERDQEVASLIRRNCEKFGLANIEVIEGTAPECLETLPYQPDCILVENGRPLKQTLLQAWTFLGVGGRLVVTASNFETLYIVSETLAELQVRNLEATQPTINRLEFRGNHQVLKAVDPIFILSGEKFE